MQEFQFTANTPSGERATAIAGGATLVGVMLLMFVIFDLLLPDLLPSRALFWVVVVVPAIVAFSIVVRRMQHSTLGEYTLRLDGRHLTVICPNQTVIDLGEVQRTAIDRHKGDGKCADIAAASVLAKVTRDRYMRKERDFRNLAKAAAAIEDALIH